MQAWHEFMKGRSLSNVTFVMLTLLKKISWKNIWHQFMKRRNLSTVTFVNQPCSKRSLVKTFGISSWKEKAFQMWLLWTNFAHKQLLKKHVASVHEGKKPFKCDLWSQLARKYHLKKHLALVHEKKKPFKCDFSEPTLHSNNYWKSMWHQFMKGKKPFKCDFCGANFHQFQ